MVLILYFEPYFGQTQKDKLADKDWQVLDRILGLKIIHLPVRVGRIELPPRPWQGRVLPLNDTRR
jgi:hypothetical protein